MMTIQKVIAMRVSKLLIERNMTPYALSVKSGLTKQAISNILNEKYNSAKFETVVKLADGFDMEVEEFVSDDLFKRSNLNI